MFYFGVDYYPEHWPEERWPIDAQLMSEAGFNVVRLAEFAWSKMEPVDGTYDFDWLDRAIAGLEARGMKVILGTPTASPPAWLMTKYPELFRVGDDGIPLTFGNRREYCPNQPIYHDYTRRIVTAMAEHYHNHPAVIGWQVDNEFGDRCYCSTCAAQFQTWLRGRYEEIDELNQKWGTNFWSHVYNEWAEIPLPLKTGGSPNPGLALDFYRFASDSYVVYQQIHIDILKNLCPNHFVTHNLMGFHYDKINYFDLARNLDMVTWDAYQRTQWSLESNLEPSTTALGHATMRGLKRQNFWVMEQQGGQGGWESISSSPRPGELRLWAYQAMAHGADAILFFRWRSARFGTEQYWQGLLDHDGHAGRRYQEVKRMGAEVLQIGDKVLGSEVKSSVAMVLSYDSRFAFQIQPNNPHFSYPDHFHKIYQAFHQYHVSVDVTGLDTDISAYRLLIAPAFHLITEQQVERLKHYVEEGGTLVVTQRTGVKDVSNAVVNQRLPGLLAEMCGVEVEEFESLGSHMRNELMFTVPELADNPNPSVGVLCDILKPTTARVVARYRHDYYAGEPAITLNQFGKGRVLYVGAVGDEQLYNVLANWLLDMIGTQPILVAQDGIEVSERWQGNHRILFVLNHTSHKHEITLENSYTNLLDNRVHSKGKVVVSPYEILLLSEVNNK